MTVGQVVDFVIAYNDRHEPQKEQKPRKRRATQAEIDAYFG